MNKVLGSSLLASATIVATPTSLLAHGGHAGAHEGLFGFLHTFFDVGSPTLALAVTLVVVVTLVLVGGARSRTR